MAPLLAIIVGGADLEHLQDVRRVAGAERGDAGGQRLGVGCP